MSRKLVLGILVLMLAVTTAVAGPSTRWFHIRVVEKAEGGETVRVNVPIEMIESVLPMIDDEGIHHGKVRFENHDVDTADLRRMLSAVRDAADGEYVTVDGPDENVRIRKENGVLLIDVDERDETPEQVHVKIRMDVLDAMLSGDPDQIDLLAGLRKMGEDQGDLVTVYSDDETVHIWVDDKNTDE